MVNNHHDLRIHGDNILECESALKLINSSLKENEPEITGGSAYCPLYSFISDTNESFDVQLFAGQPT